VATPGKYSDVGGRNVIYKMDASLSNVIYKSKFGYVASNGQLSFTPYLFITAFKVDSCQNIYLSGWAHDKALPTTPDKFQNYGGGVSDIYVCVFKNNCSALSFASYIGGPGASNSSFGEHADGGISHFDDKGYLYQAICAPPNLSTTSNAYALTTSNTTTNSIIWNNAFLKIDFQTFVNASSSYGSQIIGCPAPFTASFVSTTNTGNTQWVFGDGSLPSLQPNTTHVYSNYGNYNVLLIVTDTNTCNRTDSIKSVLSVIPPTEFDLGEERLICLNSRIRLTSNISAVSYTWSTGATSANIFVSQPGIYGLTIYNGGCTSSDEITVKLGEEPLTARFPNVMTPNGDGVNDVIDFNAYRFDEMEFILFDRWGNERYRSKEVNKPFDAEGYHDGTYYYIVNYLSTCTGQRELSKGFISIFR
jgi:PKD repeat protein